MTRIPCAYCDAPAVHSFQYRNFSRISNRQNIIQIGVCGWHRSEVEYLKGIRLAKEQGKFIVEIGYAQAPLH